VVTSGDLIGVRVQTDLYGLRRDDVVLGIDTFRTTSAGDVASRAKAAARHVTIAVRRGTPATDLVLDVRQQE
jgi:hypothetical protein